MKLEQLAREITPLPWQTMEGKTLIHVETTNLGDDTPCGMPVCSIPKKRKHDAAYLTHCANHFQQVVEALDVLTRLSACMCKTGKCSVCTAVKTLKSAQEVEV